MTFRQPIRTGAIAATFMAFTVLSGCVMDAPAPGGRFARSGAAEGNWSDAAGNVAATFRNGTFRAVATDTGNQSAQGTYTYSGPNSLSLDYLAIVRGERIRANCLLVSSGSAMNCTEDTGRQFSLVRRGNIG